jgi:hypothetical protein
MLIIKEFLIDLQKDAIEDGDDVLNKIPVIYPYQFCSVLRVEGIEVVNFPEVVDENIPGKVYG